MRTSLPRHHDGTISSLSRAQTHSSSRHSRQLPQHDNGVLEHYHRHAAHRLGVEQSPVFAPIAGRRELAEEGSLESSMQLGNIATAVPKSTSTSLEWSTQIERRVSNLDQQLASQNTASIALEAQLKNVEEKVQHSFDRLEQMIASSRLHGDTVSGNTTRSVLNAAHNVDGIDPLALAGSIRQLHRDTEELTRKQGQIRADLHNKKASDFVQLHVGSRLTQVACRTKRSGTSSNLSCQNACHNSA